MNSFIFSDKVSNALFLSPCLFLLGLQVHSSLEELRDKLCLAQVEKYTEK